MSLFYERTVRICNARGLHARASNKFVHLAGTFVADTRVSHDGMTVGGTSIMALLALAAGEGETLQITAEGVDALAAVEALAALVADGFGELEDDAASAAAPPRSEKKASD
ncbi:MAG: HPr family phosphocarrier protein [Pseudomonadota bacterium]